MPMLYLSPMFSEERNLYGQIILHVPDSALEDRLAKVDAVYRNFTPEGAVHSLVAELHIMIPEGCSCLFDPRHIPLHDCFESVFQVGCATVPDAENALSALARYVEESGDGAEIVPDGSLSPHDLDRFWTEAAQLPGVLMLYPGMQTLRTTDMGAVTVCFGHPNNDELWLESDVIIQTTWSRNL